MISDFIKEVYYAAGKYGLRELPEITLKTEDFWQLKMDATPALVSPVMKYEVSNKDEITYHGIVVRRAR
jgi:hypothetical protein